MTAEHDNAKSTIPSDYDSEMPSEVVSEANCGPGRAIAWR
jgi:hypothetical protein